MKNNKNIIKEIIPNKLTDDIDNNIKLIKRKLSIYNLQNNTNYRLEDLGINIIYNKEVDRTSIFYNYKELNENFLHNNLQLYKQNYLDAYNFLIKNIEQCKIFENKEYPDSLFLFKKDKFILEQDLKNKYFWLSYELIWSEFHWYFGYKWLEISNLCNTILEESFKKRGFTTQWLSKSEWLSLEEAFKQGNFTISK